MVSVSDEAPHQALQGAGQALASLKAGNPAILWREIVGDMLTAVGAAARLMQPGRGDFLLESVEGGETRGRYSLVGLDPDLVFRASGKLSAINRAWRHDRTAFALLPGDGLSELRHLVRECQVAVPAGLPPALALLVGYLGYETIGLVEHVPGLQANALGLPDMLFVRPTLVLVFDNVTDTLVLLTPLWPGETHPEQAIALASRRIGEALDLLAGPAPSPVEEAPSADGAPSPELKSVLEPGAYRDMVLAGKEHIAAGDIFQVVLAQRFTSRFPLPPFALYRALRRVNPSPFLYFLDLPEFALVGSSPEILVRVRHAPGDPNDADGMDEKNTREVTIRPIAGTRPRGAGPAEDLANEANLLADPKERAEHLMLLDLGRNDIGRVAAPGSVAVRQSFAIERYSHVMHIVSTVTGRLAEGRDALDALFAGFPAGTVSGAPKLSACQIIAELEPEGRGPYAGGIGYFAPDGSFDSCILLRTAVVKDGVMNVTAGAGIVADSDPDAEARECRAKAAALLAAAREAIRVAQEAATGTPTGAMAGRAFPAGPAGQ